MLKIEMVQCVEQWDQLQDEWNCVVAASDEDNPFRRRLWMRAWWNRYGSGRSLAILVARDGGDLIGIAPLFRETASGPFPARSLRFLGGTDVCSEYLGLIIRRGHEGRAVPAFLDYLVDQWDGCWDVLRLTDIPADSPQVPVLAQFGRARRIPVVCRTGVTTRLARLPESWDAFCEGLASKRRTKLRRILRDFDGRDDVEFEVVRHARQFDRCWQELRSLHEARRRRAGTPGCFADCRFEAFHVELAREYLRRGQLLLASLRVTGKPVAACYGFRQGETVYEYQRGHDPGCGAARPGHALQFMLFRRFIQEGVRYWDYLRGDYGHKRDWSDLERRCVDVTISGPRRSQMARLYVEQSYRTARRRLGHLRRRAADWFAAVRTSGRT